MACAKWLFILYDAQGNESFHVLLDPETDTVRITDLTTGFFIPEITLAECKAIEEGNLKRGSVDHPKMLDLAEAIEDRLDGSIPYGLCHLIALGTVERLRQFANQYVADGGVGKFGDRKIARQIGWASDAEFIISALLQAKFLEEIPEENGRLYIHDWHDHSDQYSDQWLADNGEHYANGKPPRRRPRKSRQQTNSEVGTCNDVKRRNFTLKEKVKVKEKDTTCTAQKRGDEEKEGLVFQTKEVADFTLPPEKTRQYAETYKHIDVREELNAARQWCEDNPSKRKTERGMPRFLNSWLSRADREAKVNGNGTTARRGPVNMRRDLWNTDPMETLPDEEA